MLVQALVREGIDVPWIVARQRPDDPHNVGMAVFDEQFEAKLRTCSRGSDNEEALHVRFHRLDI